jgi:UDP-N-acetylglucosamine 2-epimerase (non-hydrolysing)
MKKILIVFGTRPEAIKMAPLVKEFRKHSDVFDVRVCVTAQHRQMLDQVLELFGIVPEYDLDLMKKEQDLYSITTDILTNLKAILEEFRPDMTFVHGDTTTTFATSLATFYQKLNVSHIEAGLRTNDIYSPYPEEMNRQLTTKLSKYHFAPTNESKENLLKDNVDESNILVTGNSVIDSLLYVVDTINNNKNIEDKIKESLNIDIQDKKIILLTCHRRENFGKNIVSICQAIKEIADKNQDIQIIYPVHLNPNIQKPVYEILSNIDNIKLIKPLDYEEFVYMMNKAYMILTDSGGVQEEAPSLGKPVLVLRENTERPEAIKAGVLKLVGTNKDNIVNSVQLLLDDEKLYSTMAKANNPYGDGKASQRVVEFMKEHIDEY